MATNVTLYLVKPGDQQFSSQSVGHFAVRDVDATGQSIDSMRCLGFEVEAHGINPPLSVSDGKGQHPLTLSWLELEATILTQSSPRYEVGRVHIEQRGMLPLGPAPARTTVWTWEVRPEDVETVEKARFNQASAPIYFNVDISGVGKLLDDAGQLRDLVAVRSAGPLLKVELSQWQRLLQWLGYTVPPSQTSLAGAATQEHPSWAAAAKRLDNARAHLRRGEDYDALREALNAIEGFASNPYNAASWKPLLAAIPSQKAEGISELFSGFAAFCNKVGHHRDRSNRDSSGDLPVMPLDHWEADIAVAIAQYLVAYAARLRTSGSLAEKSEVATPAAEPAS